MSFHITRAVCVKRDCNWRKLFGSLFLARKLLIASSYSGRLTPDKNKNRPALSISPHLSKVRPNSSTTPIVKAIDRALKILETKSGSRKIILISDGLPNCGEPNACSKVKQWDADLSSKNIDFTMQTIAYEAKNNDDKEFECIDKLSDRFTHTRVRNKDELNKSVDEAIHQKNPTDTPSPSSSSTLSSSPPLPPRPEDKNWIAEIVVAIIGAIALIVAAFITRKK